MKLPMEEVEEAQLGLAPMLDVVLLLLIFFLVTTSFTAPRMDLELPEALTGEVATPGLFLVSIGADGALELDGDPVEMEALADRLAVGAKESDDTELVVRADAAVDHGRVVEVLDVARREGLTQVGIEVAAAPSPAAGEGTASE